VKAIGFTGASGSGKTTLIERLVTRFSAAGLRLAAIKHAHHGFDMDMPGKDSFRFRSAGAVQVLVASGRRWALLCDETTPGAEPASALARQLARLDPCDLVLIEGFRGQAGVPFIEVRRGGPGRETDGAAAVPAAAVTPGVVAIATDMPLGSRAPADIAVLDLNDVEAIAQFIAVRTGVNLC